MQLIENLNGIGKIYRGSDLLLDAVGYEISLWLEMPGGIPGLKRIVAALPTLPFHQAASLLEEKGLILEIDDGRRMPFFVKNVQGAEIANSGPLI